jgi:maleylacetoacetate isomerase
MTTLYDYWRSSASYRVRIALGLAGLAWDRVSIHLLDNAQTAPDHLARNPQGLVPVLAIDGQVFTQSLAIVEYLDETRDLGLLSGSPADRARIRALAHAIAMEIHPVCNLRVARYAAQGGIAGADWMRHFMAEGLAAYEAMLGQGRYSHGDRVSLADICLMPQVYNARRWDIDLTAMPRITAIERALGRIAAFADAHPDRFRPTPP